MAAGRMWDKLDASYSGTGDSVVVLANGLGTGQATWQPVVDRLASRARFLRFDHAGMTAATHATFEAVRHDTLHGFADDLLELLEEQRVQKALVVGHSVSGMISLIAAAAAPDLIGRVVTVGASPCYVDDAATAYHGGFTLDGVQGILEAAATDFQQWAAGFAPLAVGPEGSAEGIAEFTNYLRRMGPDIGLRALRTIFLGDYRSVVPRVPQSVTVVQATEDIAVPRAVAEYLQRHLPRADLVMLSSAGHVPQLTAPAELSEVLARVIDEWFPR